MSRYAFLLLFIAFIPIFSEGDTTLIPFGATWRYLDNGTNQGTAWSQPSFSDGSWSSGPAELGYGDGDEATVVSFGPNASNKYITTYFRHSFNVADKTALGALTLSIERDDGAVVYLNGSEVFRTSMPDGTITYTTRAIGSAATVQATLDPALLNNGTNVVAVEVHQASPTSSDVSFRLQLVAADAPGGGGGTGDITRGPYLQKTRPKNITIRWRTSAPTDSRVVYSQNPSNLNLSVSNGTATTDHSITLSGLGANTKYYYRVGSTSELLSERYFFSTAPDDGHPLNSRIWVVGDAGSGTAAATSVRDAYLNFTGSTYTNVFLSLGDNAYTSGTDSEFQTKFFNVYAPILRITSVWPTLGERDAANSNTYFSIFDLPTSGEAGGRASGTEAYYSFNYGNIHFISLDSMTSSRSATGAMLTWLKADLQANLRPWIIAFWHHAPYSKGNHNSDAETQMIEMRQNANKILEDSGVDLVLSAHSNSYERTMFINGHYGTSGTFNSSMVVNGGNGRADGTGEYKKPVGANNAGTVYMVAGNAGVLGGGSLNHPAMFLSLNQYGSVVVDMACTKMAVKFLRENGTVGDYFNIRKQNLAPTLNISSPANNATFAGPASFTITVNANDADSTIRKVRFFRNGTHIGTDFAPPYSLNVSNLGAGTYNLTATVEDDLCAITTSSVVRVTVQ